MLDVQTAGAIPKFASYALPAPNSWSRSLLLFRRIAAEYRTNSLYWNLSSTNRKPGRPGENWRDVIRRDLKDTGLSWDEASELAHSRSSWRRRVAQCAFDTA